MISWRPRKKRGGESDPKFIFKEGKEFARDSKEKLAKNLAM